MADYYGFRRKLKEPDRKILQKVIEMSFAECVRYFRKGADGRSQMDKERGELYRRFDKR